MTLSSLKQYDKVIQDQVKMGFVEKVEENRPKLVDCHYLPHHSVAKEPSSTPLRVVFNCSSRSLWCIGSALASHTRGPGFNSRAG